MKLTVKKMKALVPWWQVPQKILDEAIEAGIDPTQVQWTCTIVKKGREYHSTFAIYEESKHYGVAG